MMVELETVLTNKSYGYALSTALSVFSHSQSLGSRRTETLVYASIRILGEKYHKLLRKKKKEVNKLDNECICH